MSPKISGKRKALIFGAAAFLSFFSRFAEGVWIESTSRKYAIVDGPRCAKVLQLHPRQVSDIEGGKRIEFAWRDIPYWIEVRNGKVENLKEPVKWSNRGYATRSTIGIGRDITKRVDRILFVAELNMMAKRQKNL